MNSAVVYADSWDITQRVEVNSDVTITQQSSNSSFQAVNVINLDGVVGVVSRAEQSMSLGGNDLTLRQSNNTTSVQTVNYIHAAEVTAATQSINGVNIITLEQNGGSGNIQAVNMSSAETVDELTQSVVAESFNFIGSGNNNIQAGNYLKATNTSGVAGNVSQNFSVQNAAGVSYQQTGSNNVQAGNVLVRNIGFAGVVEQTFTVNQVTVSPGSSTDGNGSVMAANYTQ